MEPLEGLLRRRGRSVVIPRTVAAILLSCLSAQCRPSAAVVTIAVVDALALPRRPIRPGGSSSSHGGDSGGSNGSGRRFGSEGGGGGSRRHNRRGGRRSGGAHFQPRYFTSESLLPPLDVTELSAYTSSDTLNGTDVVSLDVTDGGPVGLSAAELFTAPYVAPSTHQSPDLGCATHVCGPLPVVYTNDPRSVERWLVDNVRAEGRSGGEPSVLGFDVESVPDAPWISSRALHGGPALVQISTPHACLVAQLTRQRGNTFSTSCPALEPLLRDPTIIKAGAGIDDDMLELFRFNPRLRGMGRFDLGGVGASVGRNGQIRRVGLARLARSVLGIEMRKSRKLALSDWSRSPLDETRIAYAARDAWAGAAVMMDLSERQPDVFGPDAVMTLLEGERTVEELDERARRRKEARSTMAEVCEQFREYGDLDREHTLREQMPESIAEEMERLQTIVDETAPEGPIRFHAKEIGLIL